MYIILCFLAFFGFLPLGIILYKRSRVKKILNIGLPVKARVYDIRTTRSQPQDFVHYAYQARNSSLQYTGTLTTAVGTYKKGQTLEIFYLPDNPRKHTVKGAWQSGVLVGLGVAIALFVLFFVYKLFEMVQSGEI